jgi:uncharacterized protein (DUF2147 family)
MKKSIASIGLAAMLSVTQLAPAAAQSLSGTWLTADASTRVLFAPCGQRVCGRIVWLREPVDPQTSMPWRDKFNPDETAKREPLIGLVMINGLEETTAGRWDGELYNPLDGRTYAGSFRLVGSDRLELKGCAFAGLFCQSETWTRIAP